VLDYVRNDSCAAGAGVFVEEMAAALEKRIDEISSLAFRSKQDISLNSTCTIFAESEVISLINEGIPEENIARAICDAIAARIASLLKGLSAVDNLLFIGGVARNQCVVDLLGKKLGRNITIPTEPAILTAVGAALIAQDAAGKIR
jgi:predicted CoA-substrate-specific enzyme activase